MKGTETRDTKEKPTLADHPGLDNDEATNEGKMMTASGSAGASVAEGRDRTETTPDDHPGLENDEATDEGKMMTASGSHPLPDQDPDGRPLGS